ncbi:L-seryl-tRNA(Sec) selenium transferase [bacterium]|nr:L-seryl-tRNA(Sec) selenium transferase [bacterium]
MSNVHRQIPPVHELLESCLEQEWGSDYSREQLVNIIREELKELRENLREDSVLPERQQLVASIGFRARQAYQYSLKSVINATGIIVHTNLGRAPIQAAALTHLQEIASGYSNLEFDLSRGERGSRDKHLDDVLRNLLPVEASLVVNNNAAALLLVLNSLAENKEVIVSRGELIEIGGSFRLPDVMKKSGAILREVGTTNKTRTSDYRKAINDQTGMILIVHPSNYQIIGFAERPVLEHLVALGKQHNIPVVEDQGSGIFTELESAGISEEPLVSQRLESGLDLITFSGDKILGGPQAGVICGKKIWIDRCRNNPLFRALRVDKMIYATLESTLLSYAKGVEQEIPVISMISQTAEQLRERGTIWLEQLQKRFPNVKWSVESTLNYIGGGVAPMKALPSYALCLHPKKPAQDVMQLLRESNPPVIARVEEDRVFFELRTIRAEEQEQITLCLTDVLLTK